MPSAAEAAVLPLAPKPAAALSALSFVPLAASMIAVFGALLAQQAVIDAAEKWRNR